VTDAGARSLIRELTSTAGNHSTNGSTVNSAWKSRHELAENACPECQGSTYVPGPMYEERMVDECPECKGTGKAVTKNAADVVSLA
jgi:DnaJ-class molecular chaperone